MEQLRPPSVLSFDGNVSDTWKKFKQLFEIYLIASGIDKKDDAVKVATFLHVAGEQAVSVFNSFKWDEDGDTDGDNQKLAKVMDKFSKYCEPRKNLIYLRHMFFTRNQNSGELFDAYVTDLTNRARECEFAQLTDSLIRDRIVCGILDDGVRRRLLREADLTLKRCVDICRANEVTTRQMSVLFDDGGSVNAIGKSKMSQSPKQSTCFKCGYRHDKKQCPAFGQRCNYCDGLNHFVRRCPNRNSNSQRQAHRQQPSRRNQSSGTCRTSRDPQRREFQSQTMTMPAVNTVDYDTDLSDDTDNNENQFFIHAVHRDQGNTDSKKPEQWKVKLKIDNETVEFKIDTGAQCNVMPKKMFDKLGVHAKLRKSTAKLTAYSGHKLKTDGKAVILCEHKGILHPINFHVVEGVTCPVVGASTCENELKVVKRIFAVVEDSAKTQPDVNSKFCKHTCNSDSQHRGLTKDQIVNKYKDIFQGLGCLDGEVSLTLKPNSKPVVHPPRNVPIALKDKLKAELDCMEKQGVITRQVEPTEWVNSIVTVVKPSGKIRVCIDPRDLNQALEREYYPMKTIEQVSSSLKGAKYFTKLDATSGYWQLALDEQSSKLCTFNSPFGRYRYLRLPMGVKSAPEIFQRRMATLVENLDGVEAVMDDVLVWGTSEQEHDTRLLETLDVLKKAKLKLNPQKFVFKESEMTYLGHVITPDGLKPDPEKVRAILDMPKPTDKAGLQRFLGVITYLSKFIPDMSSNTEKLRQLLCKDVIWEWNHVHEKCFNNLKEILCKAPVLAYYDSSLPLTLSVDASSVGLGATILQQGRPIAYASKALTSAERNYAQIEKELLAIVFGCKKFNSFVACRTVKVETDHKPLEAIMKKPLHKAPLRLQRMLMQLQHYELVVEYKKGIELYIADTLSRAHLPDVGDPLEGPLEVYSIKSQMPMTGEKFLQFQAAVKCDQSLSVMADYAQNGWPNLRDKCPIVVLPYWNFREEISIVDGVLFKGNKVIVPKVLRKELLLKLHRSHQGIVRTKHRAREVMYWPGMQTDIENLISQCETCSKHANKQPKQPLLSHELPDQPWIKVASDLFEYQGIQYLVCVDYFSKYPEVIRLGTTAKASTVIDSLKCIFSRHGIPQVFVSDNGPQYSCDEFSKFTRNWEFKHITSSPRYPRSNGFCERAVQTIKNCLKKSDDPQLALLEYRTTPIEGIGYSPSQLLMGRRLNSILPIHTDLLDPHIVDKQQIQKTLKDKQKKSKSYYDRSTRLLKPLEMGNTVRIWHERDRVWKPAVVINKAKEPRSYMVKTDSGVVLRRNRQHIKIAPDVNFDETGDVYIDHNENLSTGTSQTSNSRIQNSNMTHKPTQNLEENSKALHGPGPVNKNAVGEGKQGNITVTRTGRIVKPPARYKD